MTVNAIAYTYTLSSQGGIDMLCGYIDIHTHLAMCEFQRSEATKPGGYLGRWPLVQRAWKVGTSQTAGSVCRWFRNTPNHEIPFPNHRLDVFSTPMNHWDKLWKTTYQLVIAGFQLPTRTDCWKFQRFDERIVIRGNTQSTEQRLVYPGVVCGECSCGLKSLTHKIDGWNTKLTRHNQIWGW